MATSFQTPLSLGIFALCFGFVMAAWMTSQQCADMNTCSNAGASIIYTLPNDACDCIFYKVQPGITLEDSHSYCESLATTYETTCFLGLIMNSSTITSLENAGVITPSTNIFIDLNQQANGAEPDEDWQTVSWYGTNGPATDTPWAPGQPDDNAGANADQGVYTGGIGWRLRRDKYKSLHNDNNDYHEHSHDTANDNDDFDYTPNNNIDDNNNTNNNDNSPNNHNNSHNNINDNNLDNIHHNKKTYDNLNNYNDNDDNEKTYYNLDNDDDEETHYNLDNNDNEETHYNLDNDDDDDDYHRPST
uniref:C-type lectin domain-containing protein n=1 Tax=Plectus sambesii TaxID=2011161 RepID=A0A914WQ63_9BILA